MLRKTWEGIDISNQSREAYMDFLHSDINFHLTLVSLESNPYIVNLCQELIYKSNAVKLTPEKTIPLRIMGEVGTTRKQTQEAAPGFLGLPTFQSSGRSG